MPSRVLRTVGVDKEGGEGKKNLLKIISGRKNVACPHVKMGSSPKKKFLA
jgi:hypothetical protein